jgi:hypothetical protein
VPNAFFDSFGEGLARKKVDWENDDWILVLVDTEKYKVDLVKHKTLNDVPPGARVAVSKAIPGCAVKGFVLDAEDMVIERVNGPLCRAAIIAQKTLLGGVLGIWIEEAEWLPFLPNGGDLVVRWPNGETKLAKF